MNLGGTSADIIIVASFCKDLYRKCRDVGGEYDEISREVRALHTVLKHLKYEVEAPESPLNRDYVVWSRQLTAIVTHCDLTLRQLDNLLVKYGRVADSSAGASPSSSRAIWEKVRFGSTELDQLGATRVQLISHKSNLTLILDTIQLHQNGNIQAISGNHDGQLDLILDKVDWIAARIGQHNGSIKTSYDDDDTEAWKQFRRELLAEGFSSDMLQQHTDVLRAYIREIDQIGLLEEVAVDSKRPPTKLGGINSERWLDSVQIEPVNTIASSFYSINIGSDGSGSKEVPPKEEDSKFLPSIKSRAVVPGRFLGPIQEQPRRNSDGSSQSVLPRRTPSSRRDLAIYNSDSSSEDDSRWSLVRSSPSPKSLIIRTSDLVAASSSLAIRDGARNRAEQLAPRSSQLQVEYVTPPNWRDTIPEDTSTTRKYGELAMRGSRLASDEYGNEIPPDAKWTKVNRRLVSPEILDQDRRRYEARPDFVAILGVLTRAEIEDLAARTTAHRRARHLQHQQPPKLTPQLSDVPPQQPLRPGASFKTAPAVPHVLKDSEHFQQPTTSKDAMIRWNREADAYSLNSRAATWGTRRRSKPSLADWDVVNDSIFLKKSSIRRPREHGRPRNSSIIDRDREQNAKIIRKKSDNCVKRSHSAVNVVEESEVESRRNSHETLAPPPHAQYASASTSKLDSTIAAMGSMAAIGAGHTSSRSISGATTQPKSPLLGTKSFVTRARSKSELTSQKKVQSGIAGTWQRTGGPPVAVTASVPVQQQQVTGAASKLDVVEAEPSKTEKRAEPEEEEDEDDESANEDDIKTEEEATDPIIASYDGFKAHVRRLNPDMDPKYSWLVSRMAHQQEVRYKNLLSLRVKHQKDVFTRSCISGQHCVASRGDATLIDTEGQPHKLGAANTGLQIVTNLWNESDSNPEEGALTDVTFPQGVPKPPTKTLPAEFECQLCFKLRRFQKPSDWTKHVHEDVQPFTCTYDNCEESKSFKRKADWVRHENERHRHLEWWVCQLDNCRYICYRKDNFLQHLVREHKLPEPRQKIKAAIKRTTNTEAVWDMLNQCHHKTTNRPQDEPCKFCGKTFVTWKKLTIHLAKHMEHVSLLILRLVEARIVEADTIISTVEGNITPVSPVSRSGIETIPYHLNDVPTYNTMDMGLQRVDYFTTQFYRQPRRLPVVDSQPLLSQPFDYNDSVKNHVNHDVNHNIAHNTYSNTFASKPLEDNQAFAAGVSAVASMDHAGKFGSENVRYSNANMQHSGAYVSVDSSFFNSPNVNFHQSPQQSYQVAQHTVAQQLATAPGYSNYLKPAIHDLDDPSILERIRKEVTDSVLDFHDGSSKSSLKVSRLKVKWDPRDFMLRQFRDRYSTSTLGSVIVLSGSSPNAQATTCEQYLRTHWPNTYLSLLHCLGMLIHEVKGTTSGHGENFDIHSCIDAGELNLEVRGTIEKHIEIAQQIAWIGAALQHPIDGNLKICEASIHKVEGHQPTLGITFISRSLNADESSCWHSLFSGIVIASGFPIAERRHEVGLEISLELMAGLSGVRHAIEYEGGIILKGFCSAFLPERRDTDSIQWHYIEGDENIRLPYSKVHARCPDRAMLDEVNMDDLSRSRHFVGWWASTETHLGTECANYENIDWSACGQVGRSLKLKGATLGFQQIMLGEISLSLGAREGKLHIRRQGPYERIVHCAARTPVVLYDFPEKRAWLVPSSAVILHIAKTRHHKVPVMAGVERVILPSVDVSINDHEAAEKILLEQALFKLTPQDALGDQDYHLRDLVRDIWSHLDSLIDKNVAMQATSDPEVRGTMRSLIRGWEFMDIVHDRSPFRHKETYLEKSCGGWPVLAKDIDAILLFGSGFEDIIKPKEGSTAGLCHMWKSVPQGKDYLTASVPIINQLYEEAGSKLSRRYLTSTLLQWNRGSQLFEHCVSKNSFSCSCDRLQQVVPEGITQLGTVPSAEPLDDSGAVIFGQARNSLVSTVSKHMLSNVTQAVKFYKQPNIDLLRCRTNPPYDFSLHKINTTKETRSSTTLVEHPACTLPLRTKIVREEEEDYTPEPKTLDPRPITLINEDDEFKFTDTRKMSCLEEIPLARASRVELRGENTCKSALSDMTERVPQAALLERSITTGSKPLLRRVGKLSE